MFDLVYQLGTKSYKGKDWEVKYSIRSFVKNFKGIRKIYIIGHRPSWLSDKDYKSRNISQIPVLHIPFTDYFTSSKDSNLINRLIYCSGIRDLSPMFIKSSDDQFLLQPSSVSDFMRTFRLSWGDKVLKKLEAMTTKDQWHNRMYNTVLYLQSQGLTFHNFDCHLPQLIAKKKCIELLKTPYAIHPGMNVNTLYFNYCEPERESVTIYDKKTFHSFRNKSMTKEQVEHGLNNYRFAEFNNEGMKCTEFVRQIEAMFPEKLHHEV